MGKIYKPPGVVMSTSSYYVRPKMHDETKVLDFLRLTIIVKAVILKSERGEIKISDTILNTKKPIQLVEGENIEFVVNTDTNQITINSLDKNEGLVGSKSVDESTIGHGKVLSYDDTSNKLIYVDITGAIETVVNSVIGRFVEDAVNEKFISNVPDMINQKVESTFNETVPNLIDNKVDNVINDVLPNAIEEALDSLEKIVLVVRENPIGIVDGVNSIFELEKELIENTEQIYLNGVLQEKGENEDYVIENKVITFTFSPKINSRIRVNYSTRNSI